jgi:hypothetical protein
LPANRSCCQASTQPDYEAELAIVIGKGGRHIPEGALARPRIRYTILNDSARFPNGHKPVDDRQDVRHFRADRPVNRNGRRGR